MRTNLRPAAVVAAALLGTAAPVWGGETSRGGYELALSTGTPATPTGLKFHVLYKHPDDPDAKPPSITGAVFELPAGLRLDTGAVPRCAASDDEIKAAGRDACPAESQVGTGTLIAMTGVPGADPVTADLVVFNGDRELIEVVFFQGTNAVAGMDRLTIEGSKLIAHPPATPGGPPDGRTAVREIRLDLPRRLGAGGRPYVLAPPDCTGGVWVSRAHYEFADGGTTDVTSEAPCTAAPPALRVRVTPHRVRAGRRTTFAFVASSSSRECIDSARVRIGTRRALTGARGRARVTLRFRKPGLKRVTVTKAGCRSAHAAVRVRA